jgi:hypothetical protein
MATVAVEELVALALINPALVIAELLPDPKYKAAFPLPVAAALIWPVLVLANVLFEPPMLIVELVPLAALAVRVPLLVSESPV